MTSLSFKDMILCNCKHDAGIKSIENEFNSIVMIGSSGIFVSLLCGLSETIILSNNTNNRLINKNNISFILQSSLYPSTLKSRIQLALNLNLINNNNQNNIIKLINNYQLNTIGKFRTFISILCFSIIGINCSLAYREGIKFYEYGVYNGIAPINNINNHHENIIIRIGDKNEISSILNNNNYYYKFIPVVYDNNNEKNNLLLYSIYKASSNGNKACYYNTITAPDMIKNSLNKNKNKNINKIIIQTCDKTLTINESKLLLLKYSNIIGIPCELLYIQTNNINNKNNIHENIKIIPINIELILNLINSKYFIKSNIISTTSVINNYNNIIVNNMINYFDIIGLFVRKNIDIFSSFISHNNLYNNTIEYINKIIHKPLKYIIYFDVSPNNKYLNGHWINSLYNKLMSDEKYELKKELPKSLMINDYSTIIIYHNNDYDTIEKAKLYAIKYNKCHILIILNDMNNNDIKYLSSNISIIKLQDLYEDSWKNA